MAIIEDDKKSILSETVTVKGEVEQKILQFDPDHRPPNMAMAL